MHLTLDTANFHDVLFKADNLSESHSRFGNVNSDLSIDWNAIEENAKSFPIYDEESLYIINNFLGYLPKPEIYIPHQPFIRTLSAAHYTGSINEDHLINELEFHCKRIRNDDMKKFGWAVNRHYSDKDYEYYETYLGQYKSAARNRLSVLMGDAPPLELSLGAEIFMRQVFLTKDFDENDYTVFENRAASICYFKGSLLTLGSEAADDSFLYGRFLCDYAGLNPYTLERLPE